MYDEYLKYIENIKIEGKVNETDEITRKVEQRQSLKQVILFFWDEASHSYSSSYTLKWSFWVIISTCINYQVGNYIQPLWEEINPSTNSTGSSEISGI